jgi:uncharacterized protein (UPF0303 family)
VSEPAPWPTLQEIAAQEDALQFARFTNDDAWALGSAFVAEARPRNLPVVIEISRAGQTLFHAALAGSTADNDAWVARKSRVVMRFGHSSLYVGQQARDAGTTFEERFGLSLDEYAAHGGAFPLTVRDVGVVGVIAVSGLPQVDDHNLVVQVVSAFLETVTRPA